MKLMSVEIQIKLILSRQRVNTEQELTCHWLNRGNQNTGQLLSATEVSQCPSQNLTRTLNHFFIYLCFCCDEGNKSEGFLK